MNKEDKSLLLQDLCARLPYHVCLKVWLKDGTTEEGCWDLEHNYADVLRDAFYYNEIKDIKPYLRPMSSMTEEEKKELLCTIVGKDIVKYFQVLSDGSIDNTDAAHQDLHNFTMHWINFDGSNTTSYIDWLNKYHFDYRGLIEKGFAIKVTKENNPYKEYEFKFIR